MCGIFLVYDKNNIDVNECLNCLNYLKKRGPDHCHYDLFNNLFIGQTVLEISGK